MSENEEEKVVSIPFVAHEASMNRMERTNNRLFKIVLCELLAIVLMFSGIMFYFYMPTEVIEDTNTQEVDDITDSEVNQTIGE